MQNIPFTLPGRKLFAYARACAELTLAYVLHGFPSFFVSLSLRGAYASLRFIWFLVYLCKFKLKKSLRGAYASLRFTCLILYLCKLKLTQSLRWLTFYMVSHLPL